MDTYENLKEQKLQRIIDDIRDLADQKNRREEFHKINNHFKNCIITNIRRGKGDRSHIVYADLRDATDTIIISATLEYITDSINQNLI